jgi:hypothetical protein
VEEAPRPVSPRVEESWEEDWRSTSNRNHRSSGVTHRGGRRRGGAGRN